MRPPRYAVIPTNGRECLDQCLAAIRPQVDMTILVKTKEFTRYGHHHDPGLTALSDLNPEINISRWWNLGLELASEHMVQDVWELTSGVTKWDVAIINDDTIIPEGWFDAVAGQMRDKRAVAASSGSPIGMPVLHTRAGPRPLDQRMQGFAFIVAGETGIRADEQFRWYAGDDDLEWRLSSMGGVVVIPGFPVQHLHPNGQVTPEIHELIAKDMQSFVDKWGQRPW